MDRSDTTRRRWQDAPHPTSKPSIRIPRDRQRSGSGRFENAKDDGERPARAGGVDPYRDGLMTRQRKAGEDEGSSTNFTVTNVGAGGTLYLKPSRMSPAHFTQPPATPPRTADGTPSTRAPWPELRQSSASGTWTPRPQNVKLPGQERPKQPPPSLANAHQRRRTRSHSFSTINDANGADPFDTADLKILLNDKDNSTWRKSSIELRGDFLDLKIPHYRLGTPRFSDRGTACLHNSMYTVTTDDMRSSVFSRAEFEKIFPTPPGQSHPRAFMSRNSSASLFPQSTRGTRSVTPIATRASSPGLTGNLQPAMYDEIEANVNDPSVVRYSSSTGRIIAATPARLVVQITSPMFLDYELLSDFFLVFRSFSKCDGLLDLLMARMKWALDNNNDTGRIVRVRTFVALRHWILNYFTDDFLFDLPLRQRFCDLVNGIMHGLRRRDDSGGSDANVIGELKKCWRRVCATYWPEPDALNTSPDLDINPGGTESREDMEPKETSRPTTPQRNPDRPDFRRSSLIQLPLDAHRPHDAPGTTQGTRTQSAHIRTASIPTSPMSGDSLTVLSCSVPFLRALNPSKDKRLERRAEEQPVKAGTPGKPTHQHKRSGSFTDALRDQRIPLSSAKPETVDIKLLRETTFTGGLVRGLLLQPCSSKVDVLVLLSPGLQANQSHLNTPGEDYFQERQHHQNAGVKRIVGDVRRALSSRRGHNESPASSHRSTNSADSRNSATRHTHQTSKGNPSSWQQLRSQSRVDMLGALIEDSYAEAFRGPEDALDENAEDEETSERPPSVPTKFNSSRPFEPKRFNSHVTTRSRSIIIVDDTRPPEVPRLGRALPSTTSWGSDADPRFLPFPPRDGFEDIEMNEHYRNDASRHLRQGPDKIRRSSEPALQDFSLQDDWTDSQTRLGLPHDHSQARASSGVVPPNDTPHQLRRRPGGDLKAAGHVHDLEMSPRPATRGSFSTYAESMVSPGFSSPGLSSPGLSGTHFSGQQFKSLRYPTYGSSRDSMTLLRTHSSQPNMRPSFQHEVSHLAELPERSHHGGIDDALAKLEGKSSSDTALDTPAAERNIEMGASIRNHEKPRSAPLQLAKTRESAGGESALLSPRTETQGASIYHLSASEADTERSEPPGSAKSPPERHQPENLDQIADSAISSNKSVMFSPMTESHDHATDERKGLTSADGARPKSNTTHGSFLLNDNESLSDISTEIADHSGDESLDVQSFFFDDTVDDDAMLVPPFRPPPTPPSTVGPANHSPQASNASNFLAREQQNQPLKETTSAPKLTPSNPADQQNPALRRARTAPTQPHTSHLPFVLAFESEVIAEQLTIIEKDALDEVYWKDLIGLKWQPSPPPLHNWVDFLKNNATANGTELVVARFNLMVKWVASECVLTASAPERARGLTKYIHIASHAHRMRNYASTYQITLALLSADIARLHRTWALVPAAEKESLAKLEKLCQPQRNFAALRAEMETGAAVGGTDACIPFLGLYMHDLMFNAQKPARLEGAAPGREGEALVNFERFQTSATVAKSLLRLIEASSQFEFRPQPEVLSRCLWMAALDDAELAARSRALEP